MVLQVEYVCRCVRANNIFFGGMQVVAVGDFLQLRPVPNQLYADPGHHIFTSSIFQDGLPHKEVLDTVVRQTDHSFVQAVNELERGVAGPETLAILEEMKRPIAVDDAIHLFATNFEVDFHNLQQLLLLPGDVVRYTSLDAGSPANLRSLPATRILLLKIGAPVVLLKNLSSSLVNGLRGVVERMEQDGPWVKFLGTAAAVQLKATTFSVFSPEQKATLAERQQIPLALAFALTVHKVRILQLLV